MEMKFPNRLEVAPDPSKVLMSESLKGNVPELEEGITPEMQFVIAIGHRRVGAKEEALVGSLVGVLFDVKPEIEIKVPVDEAIAVVQAQQLSFDKFEMHYGDKVFELPGPFTVAAARMGDFDVRTQMCVLMLSLQRTGKKA
jgi:hypothetical protein